MKLTKENFNLIFNYIDEQVNDDVVITIYNEEGK